MKTVIGGFINIKFLKAIVIPKLFCVCVYQYAGLTFVCCWRHAALHFPVKNMLDLRWLGEVCVGRGGGGGNGLSSNSVCRANGLIYKGYTLQRYSDKKITNSH